MKDRLDRYLTSRVPFLSRTRLQRLIESGGATVNARPAKPSTRLRLGDTVELVIPLPEGTSIRPEPIDLDVLYEDEHLIVLNKRPGIIVHPARSENSGTIINALAWRFQHQTGGALSTVGEEFARPGVVHRLDRDTTGCIVFAKQDEAHWKLGAQFEHRRVEKRYLALVHGSFEPQVDVIDLPIGPHPSREKGYREKHVVRHDEFGKASLTIARVVERYRVGEPELGPEAVEGGDRSRLRRETGSESRSTPSRTGSESRSTYSLLELELKTGRTHQIRVHLSYRGYPIVGDDMYAGRPLLDPAGGTVIARQALHAALLEFDHPISGERLRFEAPPPPDFAAALALCRAGAVDPVNAPGRLVTLAE
ncbi:MAG: RluA family pseudouridine synthase [Phycisphaerales bacterium]